MYALVNVFVHVRYDVSLYFWHLRTFNIVSVYEYNNNSSSNNNEQSQVLPLDPLLVQMNRTAVSRPRPATAVIATMVKDKHLFPPPSIITVVAMTIMKTISMKEASKSTWITQQQVGMQM